MASDDVVPNYPPTRIVIDVPLDDEPKVIDDGGLAPYLLYAVLHRTASDYETVWEVSTVAEGDE